MPSAAQKLIFMNLRRQMMSRTGASLPRADTRTPKQLPPLLIEAEYYRIIMAHLAPLFGAIDTLLIPVLPGIKAAHARETKFDAYGADIDGAFEDVRLAVQRDFDPDQLDTDVDKIARRTSAHNKAQLTKQFRTVLGVNPLMGEPYLASQLASFTTKNVALIKSIEQSHLSSLQTKVTLGVENGASIPTLKKTIKREFDVTDNKAQLIARDQVGKLTGTLNGLRQQDAGLTHYIWTDSGDNRVRDSHIALHGKRFSWKKPPVAGTNGERLHPGQAIQCRCQALPDFKKFKDALMPKPPAKVKAPVPTGVDTVESVTADLEKLTNPLPPPPERFTLQSELARMRGLRGQAPARRTSGVNFPARAKLENLQSVERGLSDVLGKHGVKVVEIGTDPTRKRLNAYYQTTGVGVQRYDRLMFKASYFKDAKAQQTQSARYFKTNKASATNSSELALKRANLGESARHFHTLRQKELKATKRWSVSGDLAVADPLEATARHEAYHAVYSHKNSRDYWGGNLSRNKVTQADRLAVSEYGASLHTELFAEVGAALDMGIKIPANVKKAFTDTLKGVFSDAV